MKKDSRMFTMKILLSFLMIIFSALIYLMNNISSEKSTQNKSFYDFRKVPQKKSSLIDRKIFRIEYKVTNPKEETIADILWMKKAARISKSSGFPHFKIKQRTVKKRFEKRFSTPLSTINGQIEATQHQMSEYYDSEVIESLPLENDNSRIRNIRI